MEAPCWCPFEGHKYGGRKVLTKAVIAFCNKIDNLSLNTCLNARALPKAKKNVQEKSSFHIRNNLSRQTLMMSPRQKFENL